MADQELGPEWVEAISGMAQLLSHPMRVRLIAALTTGGPNSASRLSEQFGDVKTEDCSYHLGVLRDRGAIKRFRTRHVRGAREIIYRFRGEPSSGAAAGLSNFLDVFEGSDDLKDPNLVLPLTLDERGLRELRDALTEVRREVRRIRAASDERRSAETNSKEVRAVVRLAVIP